MKAYITGMLDRCTCSLGLDQGIPYDREHGQIGKFTSSRANTVQTLGQDRIQTSWADHCSGQHHSIKAQSTPVSTEQKLGHIQNEHL